MNKIHLTCNSRLFAFYIAQGKQQLLILDTKKEIERFLNLENKERQL